MRIMLALIALALAAICVAQESKVTLREGPGKDKAMACLACHSLDYIEMNSHFLNKDGWTASVNKMITVFGAPIDKADAEVIAAYLAENYGVKQ